MELFIEEKYINYGNGRYFKQVKDFEDTGEYLHFSYKENNGKRILVTESKERILKYAIINNIKFDWRK